MCPSRAIGSCRNMTCRRASSMAAPTNSSPPPIPWDNGENPHAALKERLAGLGNRRGAGHHRNRRAMGPQTRWRRMPALSTPPRVDAGRRRLCGPTAWSAMATICRAWVRRQPSPAGGFMVNFRHQDHRKDLFEASSRRKCCSASRAASLTKPIYKPGRLPAPCQWHRCHRQRRAHAHHVGVRHQQRRQRQRFRRKCRPESSPATQTGQGRPARPDRSGGSGSGRGPSGQRRRRPAAAPRGAAAPGARKASGAAVFVPTPVWVSSRRAISPTTRMSPTIC